MNKKCFGTDARKVVRQSFLVELELFSAATSQIYAARPEFVEIYFEKAYDQDGNEENNSFLFDGRQGKSREVYMRGLLGIPEHMAVLSIIAVGCPDKKLSPHTLEDKLIQCRRKACGQGDKNEHRI
ncbi:hypothetical protein [Eisenbergiella sp.]